MNGFLNKIPQDYLDDMLVRLAHHSAGIEGNTISLPATVSIILNGTLPVSGGATVCEFYEIENHKQAFSNMLEHLENNDTLSVSIIKEIHADLTDRLQYDKGQFKNNENLIIGAELQTVSPLETPFLIQKLMDNLDYRLENATTQEEKLESILDTHIQFERIHPFSDGNGRTGRMLMNYSLLQERFPPLIIEKETKAKYVELLATQDVASFLTFAKASLYKESKRMQAFQNMDQEKIKENEKMVNLKILEWNINQRSRSNRIPDYVIDELVRKNPDIAVLVEFKGEENAKLIEENLSDYYISYYKGTPINQHDDKKGNAILIALKKDKFNRPEHEDISYPEIFNDQQPDWLKISSTLTNGVKLYIIGMRVRILKESVADLKSRKQQIEWILENNKTLDKQIVLGDFNYGPHRTKLKSSLKLNWADIIEMIKSQGYLKEDNLPYSPEGTSWKSVNLDWLVTKGVAVDIKSNYNKLDWSFGRYNKGNFFSGYLAPDGFFIRTDSTYPDHAIFTAEIQVVISATENYHQ